jgi:hypothetical protein
MILSALILLTQASPPTVGDTIWLERSVEVPAGAEVRAAPWKPDGDVGLLGRPVVRREGTLATVAYPAVAWRAGTHTILVPGPVVIGRDGVTDSLPAEARTIEVASVLPPGQPPERLQIQPQVGIVAERITSPWPLLAALFFAGALFAPLAWWWRRRGAPLVMPRPSPVKAPPPLEEWAEAGELRAVAAAAGRALRTTINSLLPGTAPGVVTSRLIRIIQEQRPAWPFEEIGTVLRALDAAQYGESSAPEVLALAERAGAMKRRLEGAA